MDFSKAWTKEQIEAYKQTKPFESGIVNTKPAGEAFARVLEFGGAVLPKRDAVDERIVNGIKNRSGKIIKSQEDIGGWPELKSEPAPKDSDHDGMPDDWEIKNELNPNDGEDRNIVSKDGYTMLEKYLNGLTTNNQ